MDVTKRSACIFSFCVLFSLKSCQQTRRRIHLMDCGSNWRIFLSIKIIMGMVLYAICVWSSYPARNIFFFQIKRIISSQETILAHRKAIISLTRTWNETNDRTKKEQTHCHPGRMCWRAKAYAVKTNNVIYQQNVTYCVKVFISVPVEGVVNVFGRWLFLFISIHYILAWGEWRF